MRYRAAVPLIGLGVALVAVAWGGQAPKPNIVPTKPELEFTFETPQMITLTPPGAKEPHNYWYMLYQIQNRTKGDLVFAPEFVLYTDTGEVVRSGKKVPTTVFAAIQKRHNNPLLQNATGMTGRVLQGSDNAKDGAAIWRDFDAAARAFDVFVGGLSDERAVVKLPSPVMVEERDEKGKVRSVARDQLTLAKTLKLSYSLPGEAAARASIKPKLIAKKWVMR